VLQAKANAEAFASEVGRRAGVKYRYYTAGDLSVRRAS